MRRKRITRDYTWSGAWVKTNETRYLYDEMLVIQERDTNNNPLVTYTRGLDLSGSRQGAGGVGGLLARTDANGSTFYHSDGNGNITALIDGNQNIVARYEYDGFGRMIGKWGALADANVYRFSSKEFQRNSGLFYYGFRFYEPNFQRWLNSDPIGIRGGINLFRFAHNNPLSWVDKWGLQEGDAAPPTDPENPGATYTPPNVEFETAIDQAAKQMANDDLELPPTWTPNSSDEPAFEPVIPKTDIDPNEQPDIGPLPPTISQVLDPDTDSQFEEGDKNLHDIGRELIREQQKNCERKLPPKPKWPGNDPKIAPPGFNWKGKPGSNPGDPEGAYYNPDTGESLKPDLDHPDPIPPHWDYVAPDANQYRIFPDGSVVPKG
ncbi:MAG TPA: RHS repeat-associated core domain-containing protein [Verrucomicrobiae bacterium]|nr:RHS repeat-associated core domain-containing protein [Verrucomicrobiae bacterium]